MAAAVAAVALPPWGQVPEYGAGGLGGVADMVEPTTHDPDEPAEGGSVYRCIGGGPRGETEPVWPSDDTPVQDGAATWQRVGTVALYNRFGEVTQHMSVTTANADDTDLGAYTTDTNTVTTITLTVSAACVATGETGSYVLVGCFKNTGSASLIGSTALVTLRDDVNWTVGFDDTGTKARFVVNGPTDQTVRWTGNVTAVVAKLA